MHISIHFLATNLKGTAFHHEEHEANEEKRQNLGAIHISMKVVYTLISYLKEET